MEVLGSCADYSVLVNNITCAHCCAFQNVGVCFNYAVVANDNAFLNIGKGTGGSFYLNFYNFGTGKAETREFIVKSLPITIITITDKLERIQMDSVSFQEV